MTDCLFCRIANNELNAKIIYCDTELVAFEDIHPQAPHHILIIPRKHIPTPNDVSEEETLLIGKMFQTAKKIASNLGIDQTGYRILINCNTDGGQTIFHLHLHLLGGRPFHWPPG